ncbi:D-2-hydroxyacid dehydrogenase [Thermanaerosceptrum fracticalcis]|uniref:D-2-hydroxyacid dehydrogenase n=1 Tax=Thermanaerosceptrum fracticalcis TaxID=1712410 RepID=A0A7G6E2A2_THEFR|nr:D-2-hydroxyacid dehydrogenase [Thermanaerosceptrum fracticalcis]QNB46206.1 D-2-hydroxyacid dehydrogenase [Thermanaerosceptrum fracticalcis]
MAKIMTTFPLKERHLKLIMELGQLEVKVFPNIKEASPYLKSTEILLTYGEDLTPEILSEATNLKWIQVISAGLDKMPFAYLKTRPDILITNARGMHGGPMAEFTIGAILLLARKNVEILENQKKHLWDRSIRVEEIAGATLGIVGVGSIGQTIAKRAKAFDMRVLGLNTDGRPVDGVDVMYARSGLHDLLSQSDYVVVVTPLTHATRDMFGQAEFRVMKPSAYFINIGRGELVQEEALLKALHEKWIRGALLDVFREEPLPPESPLWDAPNCVIIPHLSGRSPKYIERAMEIFRHNLSVYLRKQGEFMNVINVHKGY